MKMRYFNIAKEMAKLGIHKQHKIGSCLVRKGNPISVGFNKNKFHNDSPHPYLSWHSEFDCLKSIPQHLAEGSTIYVYREDKNGMPRMARPCNSCQELLKKYKIRKMCYTVDGGYKEEKL